MLKMYPEFVGPSLLRYLSPGERAQIEAVTESYKFSKGEHVIFDSDSEAILYLIERGSAEVVVQSDEGEKHVALLREGEIIGEIGFLTGRLRTADVITLADAEIRFFELERLKPLFEEHPEIAAKFFVALSQILGERFASSMEKFYS